VQQQSLDTSSSASSPTPPNAGVAAAKHPVKSVHRSRPSLAMCLVSSVLALLLARLAPSLSARLIAIVPGAEAPSLVVVQECPSAVALWPRTLRARHSLENSRRPAILVSPSSSSPSLYGFDVVEFHIAVTTSWSFGASANCCPAALPCGAPYSLPCGELSSILIFILLFQINLARLP
jgi:hypothetical protein